MPVPTDITAGTISISGSTVTGVGTSFVASDIRQGDLFIWIEGGAGQWSPIVQTVTSNTVLTLAEPWTGPTISGARYRLRYQWDSSRVSAQSRQLIEMLDNGNVLALAGLTGPGVPVFDGPHSMTVRPETDFINGVAYDVQVDTLADRAAYDGQTVGFAVLVSDVGDGRSAIYSKASNTSGDWTDPAYVTGPVGPLPGIEATVATGAPGSTATVDEVPITGGVRLDFTLPAAEGFYNAGAYDSGTAYTTDQVVRHNGSSFIALQTVPAGTAPSGALPPVDTAFWQVLAAKGQDGLGTVTQIVAGTNIAVDNTDPTAPVISSTSDVSFVQLQNFYATLAMEQAEDRLTGPVVAGPDGNGIFDGLNVLSYVNLAQSVGLDTSVTGELRASTAQQQIYSGGLAATSTNYPNYNSRLVIAGTEFSASGDRIRLRIEGPETGNIVISALWFGHQALSGDTYDFDGSQVQVQYAGQNGFTLGQTSVWSDWFSYPLNNARNVVIAFHTTSGNIYRSAATSPNKVWWIKEAANESGVSNVTGYTASTSYGTALISQVQREFANNAEGVSTNIALSAAPTKATFYAFVNLGTAVLNTDFRLAISRNGGGQYAYFNASILYMRPGGFAVLTTGEVSLAALASGTNGRWRFNINNGKQCRVGAVGIVFSQ